MASKPSPDFSEWKMNHSMIRVKDPARSIVFYEKLGLSLIDKLPQPEGRFDLYFLGYDIQGQCPSAGKARSDRQGLLELTHNYGTENDDTYTVSNGNEDPYLGLQHLTFVVGDIDEVVGKLAGHPLEKTGRDGSEQVICRDPDGYYVELIPTPGEATYSNAFHSTGLRIKDPEVSLPWYSDVLGMTLLQQGESDNITTYWLGYLDGAPKRSLLRREGLVKLIWVHGSETKEGNVYHTGNSKPQGFGHLAIAVDDITLSCEYFEEKKVNWKKRLTGGRLKSIAFILDPDGYWIEVIQNARIKEPLGVQ